MMKSVKTNLRPRHLISKAVEVSPCEVCKETEARWICEGTFQSNILSIISR